ncbi:hypothetical protein [Auraticoccus monumenti]|uniref:Uncharacterized protein n=1 Tax=Auraticoccus monumenti TaxID=675864 RepID=A0A1G7BJX9_9ACTN|nr:hypothetical protein [Auraticoccus monumenti]SDE26585.1 hypothetical protein SAMN04489747_2964 [Auraticoccus monumenti]
MGTLVEWLVGVLGRARVLPASRWWLRLVMLVAALVAMAVPWAQGAPAAVGVFALLLLVVGLLAPQGHLPALWAVMVVAWGAVVAPAVGALGLVPVALGLVGWHWAASALSVGRPHARVQAGVWRRSLVPTVVALVAVGVGLVLALLLGGLVLPPALGVTAVLVLALVGVVGLVLWPVHRPPGSSQGPGR